MLCVSCSCSSQCYVCVCQFGSEVGEAYFRDCASPDGQQRMLMEFYGTEFLLQTAETRSLEQLCQQQPEKRTIYLTNVRSQLQSLLDKSVRAESAAETGV